MANSPIPSPTPTPIIIPFIVSDSSWKSSQTEEPDWFLPGHDDSGWINTTAPSIGLCPSSLNFPNTIINEHGALPMWAPNPVEWGTAYFRKHFYIPFGNQGSVRAVFDDTGDIYINGNLVLSDTINNGDNLVSGDVTHFLRSGDNVIAIRDSDTAGICQTIQFELALTIPPKPTFPFFDDFNDGNADGWFAGASCSSPSWCGIGNWRVEDNHVTENLGGNGYMFLLSNYPLSDQMFEARVQWHGDGGVGFTIWRQDDDNWVNIAYPTYTGGIAVSVKWCDIPLCPRDDNVSTTYYPHLFTERKWQTLKLEANSLTGEIKVYLDGEYLFTHTVGANIRRIGLSGFTSGNAGGDFDDVKMSPSRTIFSDDFSGSAIDPSKWEVFDNGGSYSVSGGSLALAGGGNIPFIRAINALPSSGPFTVEFGVQYTSPQPSGDGIGLSYTLTSFALHVTINS